MYTPDPRIIAKLKEYDRHLSARWDAAGERWKVTWRGKDCLTMQNPDGSYRPLDERAVTKVRVTDTWKYKTAKDFCRVLDDEKHRIDTADRARMLDEFQQVAKSDIHRSMFGGTQITGWSPTA